jgi:YD repeat-containing protein
VASVTLPSSVNTGALHVFAIGVTSTSAANYTSSTTTYDNDGDPTSVTQGDGTGHTDTPRDTYEGDGNKVTVTDPRGYVTTTAYNADDEPTLATDPDGNATLTCYDGDGDVTQTVPTAGVKAGTLTPASCPPSYPSDYGDRLAAEATTWAYNATACKTVVTTPAPPGQSFVAGC